MGHSARENTFALQKVTRTRASFVTRAVATFAPPKKSAVFENGAFRFEISLTETISAAAVDSVNRLSVSVVAAEA